MKLIIDTKQNTIVQEDGNEKHTLQMYSKEAFELVSQLWLKLGWQQKYSYTFTWLGRPIIQLPEDMIRIQEVIYSIKPDVIIETGVAHGGSLIFYASLCKLMERGRVIGIDIEIRPHNRKAIESHGLSDLITLIEGSSTAEDVLNRVKFLIKPKETVLIILDSCHTKDHVLAELQAYSALVTPTSYIVVADGIMKDLFDTPKGKEEWTSDNPVEAIIEFLKTHPEFEIKRPSWLFNESSLNNNISYWPEAWLRKRES